MSYLEKISWSSITIDSPPSYDDLIDQVCSIDLQHLRRMRFQNISPIEEKKNIIENSCIDNNWSNIKNIINEIKDKITDLEYQKYIRTALQHKCDLVIVKLFLLNLHPLEFSLYRDGIIYACKYGDILLFDYLYNKINPMNSNVFIHFAILYNQPVLAKHIISDKKYNIRDFVDTVGYYIVLDNIMINGERKGSYLSRTIPKYELPQYSIQVKCIFTESMEVSSKMEEAIIPLFIKLIEIYPKKKDLLKKYIPVLTIRSIRILDLADVFSDYDENYPKLASLNSDRKVYEFFHNKFNEKTVVLV